LIWEYEGIQNINAKISSKIHQEMMTPVIHTNDSGWIGFQHHIWTSEKASNLVWTPISLKLPGRLLEFLTNCLGKKNFKMQINLKHEFYRFRSAWRWGFFLASYLQLWSLIFFNHPWDTILSCPEFETLKCILMSPRWQDLWPLGERKKSFLSDWAMQKWNNMPLSNYVFQKRVFCPSRQAERVIEIT